MAFLRQQKQINDKENDPAIENFIKSKLALDQNFKIKINREKLSINVIAMSAQAFVPEKVFLPIKELLAKNSVISLLGFHEGKQSLQFENAKAMERGLNKLFALVPKPNTALKQGPKR